MHLLIFVCFFVNLQFLLENSSIQRVLAIVLQFGNYMNALNPQRAQVWIKLFFTQVF